MDTSRTDVLFAVPKPILFSKKFQGLGCLCRKDNSSQDSDGRLKLCSCCHERYEAPNGYATRFRNKDLIPFRLRGRGSNTKFRSPLH